MNTKRLISILLSVILIGSTLAACSQSKPADGKVPDTTVAKEVKDADDDKPVIADDEEDNTIELTDNNGNKLTIVPVYNVDGKTVIAGYIESAKSKDGKALTEKDFKYLKAVIALTTDSEGNLVIQYNDKKEYIVLKAYSDNNGYIIALQDSIDIDKDKDTKEYFKVLSKLDNNNNLFIKLEADAKGKPINVTIKESQDKKTAEVVDEKGKTTTVKDTTDNKNIKEITDKAKEDEKKKEESDGKKDDENNNSENEKNPEKPEDHKKPNTPDKPDTPDKPTPPEENVDYISIVLKKNGQVETSGDNVTIEGGVFEGGTEVNIEGPGKYNKYYVTSETDSFLGQLVFKLSVDDSIEVKLNNVSISTQRKTALKFVNVDAIDDKESDAENPGNDLGQSGSSVETSAPRVELSFTGKNSIKAQGAGKNGAVYSECKLGIKGHGSADIDGGNNLSGICSTQSMTIKNATLHITSRAKQGISCDKKVTVNSGATINIESKGDGIHCNRFVFDGVDNDKVEKDSTINIKSLYTTECADGIDADEEITIDGGNLNVEALTPAKYALKVRKIEKGNPKGIFEINGGKITASGYFCTRPLSVNQRTVYATSTIKTGTAITVGKYKSADGSLAFLCTPVGDDVDTASNAEGTSRAIKWRSNLGTVNV